jgi:hypothetical protein
MVVVMRKLSGLRVGTFGGGVGIVLVAAGLLVIGIGWNGAAGAGGQINGVSDLRAQLPWLLSGGFLGLALVVFGAAMVVVHNARVDRARLEAKLEQLVELAAAGSAAAPASAAGLFVAGASSYHRPDCRLAGGRSDVSYVTGAEASARGLTPCRVCNPVNVETLAG